MNCAGPEGAYNTLGKIVYLGASSSASVSPEGETPPADPPVIPETPQEKNFLNHLGQRLTSPQGIISLLQQGQQFAQMDWKNPGTIMGAAAGLAGQFLGGGMAPIVGTVLGIDSTLFQTGQNDSQLRALSKNIWKPSGAVMETEMIPMMGEIDSKIVPETEAEKWTILSKTICKLGQISFDPDLPKSLPIDEQGHYCGSHWF